MSKKINLDHTVCVKLTPAGLDAYIAANSWKKRQKIVDNDMWIDEQMWVILSCLNDFSNGSPNKNPFMEIIFNDSILEDCLQPNEDKHMELLCHEMFAHWLGKNYINTRRYLGRNGLRPDFITVCVGNMVMIEYKPAPIIAGEIFPRYHVAQIFGHDKKNLEKTYNLNQVRKMFVIYVDNTKAKDSGTKG